MDEIVQLVTDFANFQKTHLHGTLVDFYRYQHAGIKLPEKEDLPGKTATMQEPGSILLRILSRVASSFAIYTRIALKDTALTSTDQFTFLATLNLLGESNKTEVTNYAMMEMSTGGDILNRLLKSGYITQRNDTKDKRSMLIKITREGKEILKESFAKNVLIRDFMLKDITEEDMRLCIQLLSPIEEKHSTLAVGSKQKTLAQILKENG